MHTLMNYEHHKKLVKRKKPRVVNHGQILLSMIAREAFSNIKELQKFAALLIIYFNLELFSIIPSSRP
jgi:hypothetical protein